MACRYARPHAMSSATARCCEAVRGGAAALEGPRLRLARKPQSEPRGMNSMTMPGRPRRRVKPSHKTLRANGGGERWRRGQQRRA